MKSKTISTDYSILSNFIALYLIYGSGDTHNNFIYNEF